MSLYVDSLYQKIDNGRLGKNIGISTGLPKLDETIGGIQRAVYSLIFAATSVGKTSFVLYTHIYRPLMERLGDLNFRIVYYSLEMTAEILLAKLLSLYIWETNGIDISFSDILSRVEVLNDEQYAYVVEAREWLEKVMEHLTIYDKNLSPNALYVNMKKYSEEHGTWTEHENTKVYKPFREDETVVVILDHIFLIRPGQGQSAKEAVDAASAYLISFRNKCSYSPVVLQQLNRNASGMDRRKAEMQEPELQDLKGSGNTSEDCDLAIALFAPFREKMSSHKGYKIDRLRDAYRAAIVLKNRYGEVDKILPMNFFGKVGLFRQLPKPEDIPDNKYYLYENLHPSAPPSKVSPKDEESFLYNID